MRVLSDDQIAGFRRDGFVHLDQAFERDLALQCQDVLWAQLPERRHDPSTWERPVARLGSQEDSAFAEAAQSRRWTAAIREVAGPLADPVPSIGGTFAVRFPVDGDPGDDGWHIDGSYLGDDGWWWANHWSKGRALLMLVLFSDVGFDDAPTRIRVGSHRHVRDLLLPYGDEGVNHQHLTFPDEVEDRPIAYAVGQAGDVYLCHPFLVHAAQRHRGHNPRFIAQPGVPWKEGGRLEADSS